eukprot:119278-Chlamydomonas_euryale.AAC.4
MSLPMLLLLLLPLRPLQLLLLTLPVGRREQQRFQSAQSPPGALAGATTAGAAFPQPSQVPPRQEQLTPSPRTHSHQEWSIYPPLPPSQARSPRQENLPPLGPRRLAHQGRSLLR